MMEVNNQCWEDKSILTGCSYDLSGPYGIQQVWQRLLSDSNVRDRKALIGPDGSVTFLQLDRWSSEIARQLSRRHQRPESGEWIIAICLPASSELVVSLLAIFKLGAAYLPIDPSFPSNRVAHILEDAKPALLLTSTPVMGEARFDRLQDGLEVFLCDGIERDARESEQQWPPAGFQELAVVLYTSGSTGTPKGVRLTHRNIYHRLNWQWRTFPYSTDEVACFKTALTFVDSIAEVWAPLLKGVSLVVVPKAVTQNPERFIALLGAHRVTRLVLVPSLLATIISYVEANSHSGTRPLDHLRLWVCSGEVLNPHLLLQFFPHFDGQVCNFYGSTEITGDVTCITFRTQHDVQSSLLESRVPLGNVLDNCAVYVLNTMNHEPVERGQIGEVFVAGAHVADGYINGTATASFVANTVEKQKGYEMMYRTGDYGRVVNGMLYYEGRADSQIKVRGHRVDLTEINSVLNQIKVVNKGAVLCYKPGQPEQEIIAFVVSESPYEVIHQSLKEKLVSYAMPRVVAVTDLPLLVNGKIDRQQLLRDYAKEYKSKPSVCKWNENELNRLDPKTRNMACALFKTVLSVLGGGLHKPLTLADNYFYVGGNSLNAVIVVTKLRDQGFFLDLGDFLEAENLQQIVNKMEESKCRLSDSPLCHPQQALSDYKIEKLNESVKDEVIRMMCDCFSQKGDLELLTGVTYQDYEALVPDLWEPILSADLSFIVKNNQGRIVACGMNCDAYDVPILNPREKRLSYVFEILEYVKGPIRESLVEGRKGHVLQNFLVATDGVQLSPAENVALVQCVEQETLSLAKVNGFHAIFTSNSSPLTQQICNDVLDYKILSEYQVNQFVASDGRRPFALAPDSQLITISVKHLS